MFLETICFIDGEVRNMEAHAKRMRMTGAHFGFEPPDLPDIKGLLTPGMDEVKLKCSITYHTKITSITFERYQPKQIETLKLVEGAPDYAFKFSDRTVLHNLLDYRNGCDDILIVRNGLITDTSYSNVVLQNEEGLFTPEMPLLNGTKRQKLISEGRIREASIAPADLQGYNRLYLINALLDIEDDVSISVDQIF